MVIVVSFDYRYCCRPTPQLRVYSGCHGHETADKKPIVLRMMHIHSHIHRSNIFCTERHKRCTLYYSVSFCCTAAFLCSLVQYCCKASLFCVYFVRCFVRVTAIPIHHSSLQGARRCTWKPDSVISWCNDCLP